MVNKYKINKFKVDDNVMRITNIEMEGKIIVIQPISGEYSDVSLGVDFGEGFEGHDLEGSIENNTGEWLSYYDLWHSNERTTKEIKNLIYLFFAVHSPTAYEMMRGLYYAYINENKSMFGRHMHSFKKKFIVMVKDEKIEETFKW